MDTRDIKPVPKMFWIFDLFSLQGGPFAVLRKLVGTSPFPRIYSVVRFRSLRGDGAFWERVVSTAKEYRTYAAECMDWAKNAKSDVERDTFLEMAKSWLQAAAMSEWAGRRATDQTTAAE